MDINHELRFKTTEKEREQIKKIFDDFHKMKGGKKQNGLPN